MTRNTFVLHVALAISYSYAALAAISGQCKENGVRPFGSSLRFGGRRGL